MGDADSGHALGASPDFVALLGVDASRIRLALVASLGKTGQNVAVLFLVVGLRVR